MVTLIWSVVTPVVVLLGALALERMQRIVIDSPAEPPPSAPDGAQTGRATVRAEGGCGGSGGSARPARARST